MRWVEALKIWNASKGGAWCVPKKNTPDHEAVMKIVRGDKNLNSEPAKVAPKKTMKPKIVSASKEVDLDKLGKATETKKKERVAKFLMALAKKRREAKQAKDVSTVKLKKFLLRSKPYWYNEKTMQAYHRDGEKVGAYVGILDVKNKTIKSETYVSKEKPLTEAGKAVGKKVLETPELASEIAKYGAETEELTAEKEESATFARKLQDARRTAMKNKDLEEFVKYLIENDKLAFLFWKGNPERKILDGKVNLNMEDRGMAIYPPDTVYYETELRDDIDFDVDEADKVFERTKIGIFKVTLSRKKIIKLDFEYDLDHAEEYYREQGDLKENQVFKSYLCFIGGINRVLEGDDAKFMYVYLQKKFNISKKDIDEQIAQKK